MTGSVRVLVVDDQRPFRTAVAGVLRRTPWFELVGEAASGEEAITQVGLLRPDLVLMDITMPGMGGVAATRAITASTGAPLVFLCSTYRREDLPPEAASGGAAAYINKEDLSADLLARLWAEAGQPPGVVAHGAGVSDVAGSPAPSAPG